MVGPDCLCVLFSVALKYQDTLPHFCAGLLIPFSDPPSGGGWVFFQASPLFTCLFVLGRHIISVSDGAASLRAHNEEVMVARGLVLYVEGITACKGTPLFKCGLNWQLTDLLWPFMITMCIYLKNKFILCVPAEEPCPESASLDLWPLS